MPRTILKNGRAIIGPISIKDKVDAAWTAADRLLIRNSWDAYSQGSANRLSAKPTCPVWRAARCDAVEAWIGAVWAEYARCKAAIEAGGDSEYDTAAPGACPWTIWQITADSP